MRAATWCLLLACCAVPSSAADPPGCPLPGDWAPIVELSDEFEGERLDGEKWHPNNPTWKGRKPGFFSKENVAVRDGELQLTARAEALPDLPEGYHTYTTAAVRSKARVVYGYFEIRCRPMDSRASSAFWFYDQLPDWWTEIDVFEIGGGNPAHEKIVHMNAHVFRTPEDGANHWSKGGKHVAASRLADDDHRYGLEWNKEELKYYFDGKVVRTMKNTHWHQPLTMNFDSETMPDWFGLPNAENLPSTFRIEYIRSWRRAGK